MATPVSPATHPTHEYLTLQSASLVVERVGGRPGEVSTKLREASVARLEGMLASDLVHREAVLGIVLAHLSTVTPDYVHKRVPAALQLQLDAACEQLQTWERRAARHRKRFPSAVPLPQPGCQVAMTADQVQTEEAGLAVEDAVRHAMSGWMPHGGGLSPA
jgi:hypothetical protein